ncbi:hypothetical protein [Bdellovibrio sp. HCB288]|uniref:hypothetical protein n=1 Tax=Bdellovibrio sp. HCB288 TaxID=3394355 RepID=UPI0039B3BC33
MKISSQRFSAEDFTEQQSWIGKLFTPLNQFMGEVIRAFSNSVTIEDNLYQEIKEVQWRQSTTDLPFKFRTKFAVIPRGLLPIYLLNRSTGGYSTVGPWVEWSYQNGEVTLVNVHGLVSGQDYTMRLLVIYG